MIPVRYHLARVKAAPVPSTGTYEVLSLHGAVWAESAEQAERMVLRTRTPVIPIPKGRPPTGTELVIIDQFTLETHYPQLLAEPA